jgi:hypothetical protein
MIGLFGVRRFAAAFFFGFCQFWSAALHRRTPKLTNIYVRLLEPLATYRFALTESDNICPKDHP